MNPQKTAQQYAGWRDGGRRLRRTLLRGATALLLMVLLAGPTAVDAQVKKLPTSDSDIVTVQYDTLEQVVKTASRFLAIFAQGASPANLRDLVVSNVLQDPLIYGSALAFQPGVTPFDQPGPYPPYWNVTDGVPMPDGKPFSTPRRLSNGQAIYCPYAYRGANWKDGDPILSMDLAQSYDYTASDVDWYQIPKSAYVQNTELARIGWWTDPYFDQGGGNISMATFVMPISVRTNWTKADAPSVGGTWFYGVVTIDMSLDTIQKRVPWTHQTSLVIGVVTGGCITAILVFAVMGAIVRYRAELPIKAGSPPFMLILLSGAVILAIAAILFVVAPTRTNGICQLRVVSVAMGIVFALAPLVARTYRIAKIFDNPKMKRVRVPDEHLARQVFTLIFVEILLVLAWLFAGTGVNFYIAKPVINSVYYTMPSCTEDPVMLVVSMAYFAILLILSAYYSYRTRKAPTEFNESFHIGVCLMFMAFYGVVLVPLYLLVGSTNIELSILIRSVGLLFGVLLMLAVLFGPKLLMLRSHLKGRLDVASVADMSAVGGVRAAPRNHSASSIANRGASTTAANSNRRAASPEPVRNAEASRAPEAPRTTEILLAGQARRSTSGQGQRPSKSQSANDL